MPIHTISVSHDIADTLRTAAHDAGLTTLEMATWVLSDWAVTYQRRQAARTEFIAALQDTIGVIPGGD